MPDIPIPISIPIPIIERIRTGRRELRALVPQRATHSAKHGVQRAQAKRPAGFSARQWKKLRGKGQPNPGEALACFHAWERASEEERAAGKVKDYAYFSKRGRKDVRAWPVLHAGSHWPAPPKRITDFISDIMGDLPQEVFAALPTDGASEHDHYLYGTPKRTSRESHGGCNEPRL
jgi:hypothetical protein